MKEIYIENLNLYTQVDDEDYDFLNQWKWYAYKDKNTYYVRRSVRVKGRSPIAIMMHRLIMKTPSDLCVDHIDHNGLNNQKYNLRNCTNRQNCANTSSQGGGSKYIGVAIAKTGRLKGTITAQINVLGKAIHLGTYRTEEEAARAYDKAALFYRGEYAHLNFPNEI